MSNHNIKLKYYGSKAGVDLFFEEIAPILTSGSYIKLRGEDGVFFGWIFNDKMIQCETREEFKTQLEKVNLKNKLDKELPEKMNNKITMKNKI